VGIVKVTHSDTSKNGKARVYFDGKNNWQDAIYVGQGCLCPPVGSMIEPQTSSRDFNGKTVWFLNGYREATKWAGTPLAAPSQLPVIDAPVKAREGWDVLPGDLSRLVSNVVGSAIAAGLIKQPIDIHRWAKSAYGAGQSLVMGFPDEGPDPNEDQDRDPDEDRFTDEKLPF
jgi:hypothetical protein